jgi:mRNA interferase MazF
MKRGEVWLFALDPTLGHEQHGTRPALVVSDDRFHQSGAQLVVIVPITSKERRFLPRPRVDPPEAGLTLTSWIITEQVRTVSTVRAQRRLGAVSAVTMNAVEAQLKSLLALP